MVARVFKNLLRTKLKEEVIESKFPGESHYRTVVTNHLNILLGISNGSTQYRVINIIEPLSSKFEVKTNLDLPDLTVDPHWKYKLLKRTSELCGLKWSKCFYSTVEIDPVGFFEYKAPISTMSLQRFAPSIKEMNVAYFSKAYLFKTQITVSNLSECKMLTRVITTLKSEIAVFTRDKLAYTELGALYHLQNNLYESLRCYSRALEIDPEYKIARVGYDTITTTLREREKEIELEKQKERIEVGYKMRASDPVKRREKRAFSSSVHASYLKTTRYS